VVEWIGYRAGADNLRREEPVAHFSYLKVKDVLKNEHHTF
jgi:hypothetical protein